MSGAVIERFVLGGTDVSAGKIAIDAEGNRYVAGRFHGRATFGDLPPITSDARREGAFVLKLDAKNKPVWVDRFGGLSASASGFDVALDADGSVFTSGVFSGEMDIGDMTLKAHGRTSIFLAKLDPSGRVLWANTYGDASEQVDMRLRRYPGGGVIASGSFSGVMSFGGPPTASPWDKAFYVARIDSNGHGRWGQAFGRRPDLSHTDTAVDAQGNVFASAGSEGTPEFAKRGESSGTPGLGPVLIKLDADGKVLSTQRFGNGADAIWPAIAIDNKGNVRYAVVSNGVTSLDGVERKSTEGCQLIAANFDTSGSLLWRREIIASHFLTAEDATIDPAGNFYIAGRLMVKDSSGLREDGYVVKVDAAGEINWTLKVADGTDASLSGIALDPTDELVAVGSVVGADSGPDARLWMGRIAR